MKRQYLILIIILLIAAFLRFYNLMWGSPYFFHPDEKNMAIAVINLNFPKNLNPYFFAYGQFPLYLSYFSGYLINIIIHKLTAHLNLPQAIFWLRFWSASTSVLTVYLVFLISKRLLNHKWSLITTLLCAFSPGLIQSAHFGTTESLLTFFFMLLIYLSLELNTKYLFASAMVLGLSISTKVSAFIFVFVPFVALLFTRLTFYKKILLLFLIFSTAFVIFTITSPFTLLDFKAFKGSMTYETSVALGKLKVFYTRQFADTVPVLFQFEKIFPYALGWPIFILGILGIGFLLGKKEKTHSEVILLFALFIYFLSNAFLYAKWTRFMAPIFPLFTVFAVYFIYKIKPRWVVWLLVSLSILPGIAFFSIYLRPDVRVTASEWIFQNIPSNSYILSETANVVDIPVQNQNYQVISFNFYDLDDNPFRFEELISHLTKADYIFIPSRRIFKNYMRLPDKYPLTNKYYELLFSGKLGFEKVAEFSSLADESAEETFTVFDHPVVRIYKKTSKFFVQDYKKLLTN